jgi:hypothetical protein
MLSSAAVNKTARFFDGVSRIFQHAFRRSKLICPIAKQARQDYGSAVLAAICVSGCANRVMEHDGGVERRIITLKW